MYYLPCNPIKFDSVRFFCSLVRKPELEKSKSAAIQGEATLFLSVTLWMKIFICSRSITPEKWLMNWSLTISLGKIWWDLNQLLQKVIHAHPKSTEAKICCHICEEPFSNMVMSSNLESRLVLKITNIFFFWKNQNTLSFQKQKSILTEKEVCNSDKVLKTVSVCNVSNSLITRWICSLRRPE